MHVLANMHPHLQLKILPIYVAMKNFLTSECELANWAMHSWDEACWSLYLSCRTDLLLYVLDSACKSLAAYLSTVDDDCVVLCVHEDVHEFRY